MPIRMRGNCRLHCEHDKLPPPLRGPSSEARRREVTPSLRVLSAADLDCSHSLRHGTGWVARDQGTPVKGVWWRPELCLAPVRRQKQRCQAKINKWKRQLIVQLANCQSETFSSWDRLTFQEIACYFMTKVGYSGNKWKCVILRTWTTKVSERYFGWHRSQSTSSPN